MSRTKSQKLNLLIEGLGMISVTGGFMTGPKILLDFIGRKSTKS